MTCFKTLSRTFEI